MPLSITFGLRSAFIMIWAREWWGKGEGGRGQERKCDGMNVNVDVDVDVGARGPVRDMV